MLDDLDLDTVNFIENAIKAYYKQKEDEFYQLRQVTDYVGKKCFGDVSKAIPALRNAYVDIAQNSTRLDEAYGKATKILEALKAKLYG